MLIARNPASASFRVQWDLPAPDIPMNESLIKGPRRRFLAPRSKNSAPCTTNSQICRAAQNLDFRRAGLQPGQINVSLQPALTAEAEFGCGSAALWNLLAAAQPCRPEEDQFLPPATAYQG